MIQKLDRSHFLIKELVESYREDWQRRQGQRDKEKRHGFYMSDVSKCDREIFYLFHHPEKKRTIADKTLIFFRHGDLYHEEAQVRLKKKRIVESDRDIEYGIEDWDVDATGRLDNFIKEDNGIAVAEIKSKNPFAFVAEEPYPEEVDQTMWYIHAAKNSKSLRPRNILDHGYILYLERGEISEFPIAGWRIDFDLERAERIRERFRQLKTIIAAGECPKRPHERESTKCQYCRFIDFCWQGVPEIKAPEFAADETIERPEQELVESAAEKYIELKDKAKELKLELEMTYEIIMRYFKATGLKEIPVNDRKIVHELTREIELDEPYLFSELADCWRLIAKPQAKLIQEAIKKGDVDPEIFERAKKVSWVDRLRIKGGKNEFKGI